MPQFSSYPAGSGITNADRVAMQPGSYYWWESPAAAEIERAKAFQDAGLAKDVDLSARDIDLPAQKAALQRKAILQRLQSALSK